MYQLPSRYELSFLPGNITQQTLLVTFNHNSDREQARKHFLQGLRRLLLATVARLVLTNLQNLLSAFSAPLVLGSPPGLVLPSWNARGAPPVRTPCPRVRPLPRTASDALQVLSDSERELPPALNAPQGPTR